MCKWTKISSILPPFDEQVIFRAEIKWRPKTIVKIFSDKLTSQSETLEYGLSGFILEDHSDFIVCQHNDTGEIYDEVVTHWMHIPKTE